MYELVYSYIDQVLDPFLNPEKRVFVGYLAGAILLASAFYVLTQRDRWRQAIGEAFGRHVWWSRSAKADYKVLLINQALFMGVTPRLVSKLAVATLIFEGLHLWFDGRALIWQEAPAWAIGALFTLALFLLDDATKYLVHRALHRWPLLWCFHRVHHSAETLTPLTVYRTHPVEGVIFALRGILVQGATVAAFIYFFGARAELVTILGANALLFAFNVAGSNLRHSHVWLSYGRWIERILISPAQHQIHHSVASEHYDKNFGAVLAIWDWIGGSLYLADRRKPVTFGVCAAESAAPHGLRSLYLVPVFQAARMARRSVQKGLNFMPTLLPSSLRRVLVGSLLLLAVLVASAGYAYSQQELNIYSHRQPFLIQPFIDAYSERTGTKVNIVYASRGLAHRLQVEGERSPADVVLTVDIARLHVYADKDLLASVDSEILKQNIPAHLRDPEDRWFAFSKRARVIAVAKTAADALKIARYEDLADPKWRGRICSRPGSHVYNRALIASMIHAAGPEKAEEWAQGVVDNLARRPQGNDRAQIKAIYEGVCDIAIINNYYFGKLLHSDKPEQRDWAAAVTLIFPNQNDRGTHVNISGGGVAKYSKHKEEAIRFLEFLTSPEAQELYGAINFEYPVNPSVATPAELRSWGNFEEDRMPIAAIADLAPQAQIIIDRVRW
ncbi:extracellular solute-binding protein [Nisaea acidiphila]|uniref:Extracellular solute-binding protein n=1 Tax=Nisaea acidiphila TaxID=1862145 RepID=A0A9J7ATR6_9PROT|nr:extracellular solute-binding protein [Nisaea acidiphila]UUX51091.1 extracellular solute-binding protein [Nisaea acidiphila]